MRNKTFFHLLFAVSPGGIWRKLIKFAWQLEMRIKVRINIPYLKKLGFQRALISEIPDETALLKRIKKGPYPAFFIDMENKEWMAEQFRDLCSDEVGNVVHAADLVVRHVFDLLGSGPCSLGNIIDWQLDFKSGYRWNEKAFYQDLKPAPYPGGYDIKVPWELSRCQHFAWLGQAYWLSSDEMYAREFSSQVEQWILSNPPQLGVNWTCTMDVAIRAINWLWGYAFFRQSPSLSDEFHLQFYGSMLEHGRHIMHNLEFSEILTSNHYISNLVGLVFLGLLLPELKEAKNWCNFGLHELESEMSKQVNQDGTNFEASTYYHRLVTELFLSATILASINGRSFSPEYLASLERMISVIASIMRPDGTTPIIGDQDNGRVHRLKVWVQGSQEWVNFCPLVAAYSAWKRKPLGVNFTSEDWTEAFWLVGPEAIHQLQQMQRNLKLNPTSSILFPDGGWAVLRSHDDYLLFETGPVGQNDQGGHCHNDSLSIDVFADGQTWIVDPGTHVYTADYESRYLFRQTRAHNTVYVPGYEQSQIDVKSPFRVDVPSKNRILYSEFKDDFNLIVAEVQYACSPAITHRRAIIYSAEARAWLIADRVSPDGLGARIHLSFPSGIFADAIEKPIPTIHLRNNNGKSFWVCFMQGEKPEISQSWMSNSYGAKQECFQVEIKLAGNPIHFWTLLPGKQRGEIGIRNQKLVKTWETLQGTSYMEK
jgi:hypothetical protein